MKRFFLTLPLLLTLISTYAPAQTTPNEFTPSSRELEEKRIIPLRKGLANFVMTRSNGQWLITVMHNMDLPQQ
jgi:hypothetical protein